MGEEPSDRGIVALQRTRGPGARRRTLTGALAAVAAAAAFLLAGAPRASAACDAPQSQPFLPWLDAARYSLAPGGALEPGSTGWALSDGAALVSGNEPFHVHAASDSHSLSLPSGSAARTRAICIGLDSPTVRLFAQNGGAATSKLDVAVTFLDGLGARLGGGDLGRISAGPAWQPTPVILLLANLLVPLGTKAVKLTFAPTGSQSGWRIDDLYVDPWISR